VSIIVARTHELRRRPLQRNKEHPMKTDRALDAASHGCHDSALLNDWHVVAASTDVVPNTLVPLTLFERDLVAWRDSKGAVHVWDDLCIHRGSRLSKGFIQCDRVVCPYHGWNYDGSAQCVLIPAAPDGRPPRKARAIAHHAVEKYGLVWVCLGTPERDVVPFAEWHDDSYKKVVCGPYRFRSGYRAVENFFDPTHFPFVHAGVNGVFEAPDPIPPYEVSESAEGLATSEIQVTQPFGDPRNIPVAAYYAYKCLRPFVAYFRKRVVADPQTASTDGPAEFFNTLFTAQQIGPVDSIVRIVCAMNVTPTPTDEQVRRRQELVYAQDAAIVEIQRPECIQLDLSQELHHRADLLSVRYRQWLRNMGITYGTV
jgi:phenylpropionate dioxygenase-like ring-hydroxylating dioxygenase large terminal subunit